MPSRPPCGTRSLTVSERHAFFPSATSTQVAETVRQSILYINRKKLEDREGYGK